MQKQFILFNLDDTLAYCNKYFAVVIDQFTEQMTQWFETLNKDEIKKKQLEIDLASIDQHGLTSQRFPESFVETYLYFCNANNRNASDEEIQQLRSLGQSVFKMQVEPLPNMYETLERLKKDGHELYIHTGGDELTQRRKITQLELAVYFENRVFISNHKDRNALEKILKEMKFDRKRTWMVGNSLRTDVAPGIELGINVIYIPADLEWEYNNIDLKSLGFKPKEAFLTLKSLNQVPEAIYNHIYQRI